LQTHPTSHAQHPQTPAQQVLLSAADRWGLLGLLAMIKNAGTDVDQGLSSVGTDLGTMGLDMGYAGWVNIHLLRLFNSVSYRFLCD
jgi:CCR4-NOT transcription complex subunit 2